MSAFGVNSSNSNPSAAGSSASGQFCAPPQPWRTSVPGLGERVPALGAAPLKRRSPAMRAYRADAQRRRSGSSVARPSSEPAASPWVRPLPASPAAARAVGAARSSTDVVARRCFSPAEGAGGAGACCSGAGSSDASGDANTGEKRKRPGAGRSIGTSSASASSSHGSSSSHDEPHVVVIESGKDAQVWSESEWSQKESTEALLRALEEERASRTAAEERLRICEQRLRLAQEEGAQQAAATIRRLTKENQRLMLKLSREKPNL